MWHEYEDEDVCLQAMEDSIVTSLRGALDTTGRAGLAVSGGRSPIPLYERLSRADIDWSKVHVRLVDDRFVPLDHPDSNERLVRRHLLIGPAATADFVGLVQDPTDIVRSVALSNRQHEHLTVAVLGMGDNGHTASLFPGAPQLSRGLDPNFPDRYLDVDPVDAPHRRISMSLAALLRCGRLVLGLQGDTKRQVFERARERVTPALPISYFIAQQGVPFDAYWRP